MGGRVQINDESLENIYKKLILTENFCLVRWRAECPHTIYNIEVEKKKMLSEMGGAKEDEGSLSSRFSSENRWLSLSCVVRNPKCNRKKAIHDFGSHIEALTKYIYIYLFIYIYIFQIWKGLYFSSVIISPLYYSFIN